MMMGLAYHKKKEEEKVSMEKASREVELQSYFLSEKAMMQSLKPELWRGTA